MIFIPCDESCIHQKNGSCTLENASAVTDCTCSGCIHKVRPESSLSPLNRRVQQPHP
ncbi:MAG: hypothetical protein II059_00205 [Clostridia bacterium]|nr:hypothetical protein [Clostridia bacterium]